MSDYGRSRENSHDRSIAGFRTSRGTRVRQYKQRDNWRTLTEKGVTELRQGQPEQALKSLTRARRLAPDERDVNYWMANACRMTGATGRSERIFRELLTKRPGDFDASFALAFLLREIGRPAAAAEALLRASRQPGVSTEQLLQIAEFLRDSNQLDAAIEVRETAVEHHPENAELHYDLGRLYQATGVFDKSLAAFQKALDLQPTLGPAWLAMAQQRKFRSTEDKIYARIRAAAQQSYGRETDMCIAFAFGKALDDLQQWQRAWMHYQTGNELAAEAMPWNPSNWNSFVDRAISRQARDPFSAAGGSRNAVFIVGMPRSGTTLLEQQLHRYAGIIGRGELNFLDHFAKQGVTPGSLNSAQRQEAADLLWKQLRLDGPENGIYIDKNPLNFRYLDLLFELLPSAKVVHVRRDSRDSCLSCYFQLFQHPDIAFTNSLEHLVSFYSGYRRLFAHWQTIYADRMISIHYEDLVNRSDHGLPVILRFIGAESHADSTHAAEQVRVVRTASVWQSRQPVHARSIGRWHSYAQYAPEFFAELEAIDAQYDLAEA